MRRVSYLFAAAAISGLALAATPGSASPLASGLATSNPNLPEINEGLVQRTWLALQQEIRLVEGP